MAKKMDLMDTGKKLAVLGFLGGFLFAQPIVATVGAGAWGVAELYELFLKK